MVTKKRVKQSSPEERHDDLGDETFEYGKEGKVRYS